MIILITVIEKDPYTKKKSEIVSHGVDTSTGRDVIIQQVEPSTIGYFDEDMQEWILH